MIHTPSHDDFRTFLFSYRYEGAEWCFEIKAKDAQDAKARIAKLPFAKYDGELAAVVPVSVGWLAKLYVFARNHFRL